MKNVIFLFCPLMLIVLFLMEDTSYGKPRATVKHNSIRVENTRENQTESLFLPYALSSDSSGKVLGIGTAGKGYYQPQFLLGGTVFGSIDEETYGVTAGAWDYRPSSSKRIFFTSIASFGHYPKQRAYTQLAYSPDEIRRGSNNSDKDDYLQAGGKNHWIDLRMEFVLPIGSAEDDGMVTYDLRGGMLEKGATGGKLWNPLRSGITTIMLRQYNQFESFETVYGDFERPVHPVEIGIGYNNTDYPPNPTFGSNKYFGIKHDFGWGEATTIWTFLEFEASKYFSLGETERAKQRVVALNFWTGDAISWEEKLNENGLIEIDGNPP